jgi:hypothetical protein
VKYWGHLFKLVPGGWYSKGMTIVLTRAAIATKWFIIVRTIENVHFENSVELREISYSYNHTKKTDGIVFTETLRLLYLKKITIFLVYIL